MFRTSGRYILAIIAGLTAAAQASPVYFVVGERPDLPPHVNETFILPLFAPADIAHARALIAQGPSIGQSMVIARIAVGPDGINRNTLASGRPPWSWHVTDFEGFADSAIEILDGWPGGVEANVAAWMANTGGYIGFAAFTVVAELPPAVRGDCNCDGTIDTRDVAAFAISLVDPGAYARAHPTCDITASDFTADARIDAADIAAFVQCVIAGTCT